MTQAAGSESAGFLKLAEHLRQHPEAMHSPPERLAERFGLPVDRVRSALETVRAVSSATASVPPEERRWTLFWLAFCRRFCGPLAQILRRGWIRATNRPGFFVGATTGLALAAGWVSENPEQLATAGRNAVLRLQGGGLVALFLAVLAAQMACFARHAMVRQALFGALVNWVVLSTFSITAIWYRQHSGPNPDRNMVPELVLLSIGLLLLAALYGLLGSVVSILGAYASIRRADRRKERLSRQQLLERLFEIEERLRLGSEAASGPRPLLEQPWVEALRRRLWLFSATSGLLLGLGYVASASGLRTAAGNVRGVTGAEVIDIVVALVFLAGWFLAQVALAFLAGRFWRAFLACALFSACYLLPEALPVTEFGVPRLLASLYPEKAAQLLASLAIAAMGSLGAAVEERARRESLLRRNDPGALLAELIEVQRLLSPSRANVCILVVDVAKSSAMKANADPYVVEYCFREYQSLVRECCESFGGTIHSTAGDGAVAGFPSAAQALAAAKRIQTRIGEFNRRVNRLASPFRLRIGLHQGSVVGELSEVQFAEVIDIAAHVEEVAPVGGIAVTEAVATDLGDERMAELKEPVDGHRVLVVLNPTEDA